MSGCGRWPLSLLLLHNLRQEAVYLRLVVAPNSGTDLGRLVWAARSDRVQWRSAVTPERRRGTLGVRVRSSMRDLAARVVEVHPVAPPLLRRLLLVRRAGSSRTMERGCAATKGLWWQVNTGVDAFAVRRWGCSSWQACASTRVVLTGGAHGLAGCTLRASKKAARCTSCCPRDNRGTIWELQWQTMSVHHRLRMRRRRVCRVFGEPMAARTDAVGRKRG